MSEKEEEDSRTLHQRRMDALASSDEEADKDKEEEGEEIPTDPDELDDYVHNKAKELWNMGKTNKERRDLIYSGDLVSLGGQVQEWIHERMKEYFREWGAYASEHEEEEGEAGDADGPTRGIVIQGGVGKKVRAELAARLEACGYSKDSPAHRVYLFCNWNKEWDASVFGAPKTSTTGELFLTTNIVPILLHDPGKGELAWGEDELQTFYDAVDLAKDDLANGKTVIVACVAGKNRSVAMQRALTRCTVCKPSCDAMERAALGYLRNKDMRIVPLSPEPPKRKREDGP